MQRYFAVRAERASPAGSAPRTGYFVGATRRQPELLIPSLVQMAPSRRARQHFLPGEIEDSGGLACPNQARMLPVRLAETSQTVVPGGADYMFHTGSTGSL